MFKWKSESVHNLNFNCHVETGGRLKESQIQCKSDNVYATFDDLEGQPFQM